MDNNVQQMLKQAWRITPATLAYHLSGGAWWPAKHLLFMAIKIATTIKRGNGRLIINLPPRHGKSLLTSIWTVVWFLEHYPSKEVMLTSYGADLSSEFSRAARDVFDEHRDTLSVTLRSDSRRVMRYKTQQGGGVTAAGIGGPLTGKGADLLLVDDYIKNDQEALSAATREKHWTWMTATARPRLEPNGTIIIIATRWHQDDICGRFLKQQQERWEHIDIPAIALQNDPLGREAGEPLWPERYDVAALKDLRETLGVYWFDAQFQQRPHKSMSGVDAGEAIQIEDIPPHYNAMTIVRAWDFASQDDTGDWSVGLKMGYHHASDSFHILDVHRKQISPGKLEQLVKETQVNEAHHITRMGIEQEPGSSGKIVISHFKDTVLPGHPVEGHFASGPLESRANPFLVACEQGKVHMVRAPWNEALKDEISSFPTGEHDDQVTAAALAFKLLRASTRKATWGRSGTSGDTQDHYKRTDGRNSTIAWGRRR